jgi:hypothetical protein
VTSPLPTALCAAVFSRLLEKEMATPPEPPLSLAEEGWGEEERQDDRRACGQPLAERGYVP